MTSRDRNEPLAATASKVRAFLLLEHPGPWGQKILDDAPMTETLQATLRTYTDVHGIRVLLMRRHGRRSGTEPAGPPQRTVIAAYTDPVRPWYQCTQVTNLNQLLDIDLAPLGRGHQPGWIEGTEPLYGVCTHGRHDICCAVSGRPVAAALTGIRPHTTWEVSHLGGDRFAANVLVLPHGWYYGRIEPSTAPELVARSESGRVILSQLRGRAGDALTVQAAELQLRQRLAVQNDPAAWAANSIRLVKHDVSTMNAQQVHHLRFTVQAPPTGPAEPRPTDQKWRAEVTSLPATQGVLTCRASAPSGIPQWQVVLSQEVPAPSGEP